MIIGIGTDIIEVERIERAINRWGDNFLHHVFTEKEIEYAKKNKHPKQHFAARFAAKEAVYKAIGNNPHIRWKDLEIFNNQNGTPHCSCKIKNFHHHIYLSISHTENYAVANAIITS